MIRTLMLIPACAALLACGILNGGGDPADERQVVVVEVPDGPAGGAVPQIDAPLVAPEDTGRAVEVTGDRALPLYAGDSTIEEKTIESPVIVRATMVTVSAEIMVIPDVYSGRKDTYSPVLKFTLNVSEYLKGAGPSSIVAVWVDGRPYDTTEEANDAKTGILAERDDRWDDREAIIFLYDNAGGFGTRLDTQLQRADHFLVGVGDQFSHDDRYSLHSSSSRYWLPAAATTDSNGDVQQYLLDVPPVTGTAPTITLGDLKTRIADVTAEYDGGDGSEAHKTCVLEKYRYLRNQRNWPEELGNPYGVWDIDQSIGSGQPAGTELDRTESWGVYPNSKVTLRFEGRDSALFATADGDTTAFDRDGDGDLETIKYDQMVTLARPVPAGEYKFDLIETWPEYAICNFDISNEWTVTATAPEDTLHEAFFDPVTDGAAVAADATSGILKPATFTDVNSASATLERIEWESGTVKFELSSDDALAGQVANFIELNGTVSLSLNADDATVDAANDTLSWPVASQPWADGDKLMLRIREAQGTCWNGTAVPNLSANPGLALDCKALLAAKDTLRGTATLNWNADTAITSWDGVTVEGTPSRVTKILLTDKSLNGTVPTELAKLTGLQTLYLDENQLTGSIPTELASLAALKVLHLSDNRLTGSIPTELASLTTLADLRLYSNRLSGGIPTELGSLTNLAVLHLDDNQLTGAIPAELGGLSNLRELFLGYNRLTGTIPTQLGSLTSLQHLSLDSNQLAGSIPTQLGSLTNLRVLSIAANQLTGSIPTQLGDLSNLRDLYLESNRLSGSIPTQLGKLTKLEVLNLSINRLTGAIPSELGKLSKLESLYLQANQLTGSIPTQLGSLANLETLWLSGNTLTGCIPSALRNVANNDLATLRLQYCTA